MKSRTGKLVLITFVAVAVLALCWRLFPGQIRGSETTADQTSPPGVPITVVAAGTGNLTSALTYTGTIAPAKTITLAPKVTGQIMGLSAREGHTVGRGELLVEIDVEQFTLALARLEAKIEQTQLNLAHQETELERFTQLYEGEAISQQQYEQATLARNLAAATLREAEAALAEAQANLANGTLYAPEGGTVLTVHKETGDLAVTGQPLVTIAAGTGLEVVVPVVEGDLPLIEPGLPVLLQWPGIAEPVAGKVEKIHPSLDPMTHRAQVTIAIPGDYRKGVKPGMSATASIVLAEENEALVVPTHSLVEQDDGTWAVYVIADDVATLTTVEVGTSADGLTAITGLEPGDLVAAGNIGQLYDGAPVAIFAQEELSQ